VATATNISDENTIVAEILIAAPRERVFQAIADPDQRRQWWGQRGLYRTTELHSDLRPGRTNGGVQGWAPTANPFGWKASIWKSSRLVCRSTPGWPAGRRPSRPLSAGNSSSMRSTVSQNTLVRIRHEGFAGNAKIARDHESGWKRVLLWMQRFVKTGETVDTREAVSANRD